MAALVAANAVFVAGEFALVATDRSRMSLAAEAGSLRARVVVRLLGRLTFHLSGTQLGITVTSLLLGLLIEPVVAELLNAPVDGLVGHRAGHATSIVVALVAVTVVQMVVAELVPKNVAVAQPDRTALALGSLLVLWSAATGPVITLLNALSHRVVRLFGVEPRETHDVVPSADELVSMIRTSGASGAIGTDASRLLTRSLRFADKTAGDALVPRVTVETIAAHASVADLAALAVETGYSRFPVVDGDIDHVVGVALAKDVFRVPMGQRTTRSVRELAQRVPVVPDSCDLESLLGDLRGGASQLAVVVDEFGSTAGIVTLEDVLEELVGEIDDEYDEPARFTMLPQGVVAIDGTARADDVEEASGLVLPEGRFETLAGFLVALLDHIPVGGESALWMGWELTVLEMDRRRVARVGVRRLPLSSDESGVTP